MIVTINDVEDVARLMHEASEEIMKEKGRLLVERPKNKWKDLAKENRELFRAVAKRMLEKLEKIL